MDTNKFVNRHVGISAEDIPSMLQAIGVKSVDELIDQTIPSDIRLKEPLNLPEPMTEREFAEHISELASKNEVFTSYIGMGWYDTVCPAPIQRNVFENPVWYTSYTPYQAEVSQGRLEALLNFQTVIAELTGLPLTNCSLLDEATAAAEAATMFHGSRSRAQVKAEANTLFVDENVFASTLAVINTRMIPQGIKVVVGDYKTFEFTPDVFGAIVQYPNADDCETVLLIIESDAAGRMSGNCQYLKFGCAELDGFASYDIFFNRDILDVLTESEQFGLFVRRGQFLDILLVRFGFQTVCLIYKTVSEYVIHV